MNKQELKSLLENIYTALTEDKTGLWTDWHPPLGDWLAPVDHFPIPYALPPTIRRAKITPIWQSPLRPRIKPTSVGPLKRYRPTLTWGPDDPSPDELRLFDHWLKDPDWNNMNKQELKSLLENIYTTLTEADIPDHPPAPPGWEQNSPEPWPWPRNPTSPTPPPPTPNGMTPFLPRMPLDPNGNPLFPSMKFWAAYYRAMRALPMGATMITHPTEMEIFQELSRQLQIWQRQQQQQRPQPNDGGPLG